MVLTQPNAGRASHGAGVGGDGVLKATRTPKSFKLQDPFICYDGLYVCIIWYWACDTIGDATFYALRTGSESTRR